jgi:hypothetical protein
LMFSLFLVTVVSSLEFGYNENGKCFFIHPISTFRLNYVV